MTPCTVCGRMREGVPPPKKIEAHRSPRRERCPMGDLRPERRKIPLLVDRRSAHMAVEIAIGAFRQAERPMDIDPEPGVGVADGATLVGLGANAVPNHRLFMPVNAAPRQSSRTGLTPSCRGDAGRKQRSERVVARFAGADALGALDRRDKDLAVADLAGSRGPLDNFDDLLGAVVADARPRSGPSEGSSRHIRRRGRSPCGPSGGRSL